MVLEEEVLERIKKERKHEKSFFEIISGFDEKLKKFDPVKNCVEVDRYFGEKCGPVTVIKNLQRDKIIDDNWFDKDDSTKEIDKKDFKGLYIFIHDEKPIYIGISRSVVRRIIQHVKGHNHFSSTLAFNIALLRHEINNKEAYLGQRKLFEFKKNVIPVQQYLRKQKVAFCPIQNSEELYLFEIFCAMHFKCALNSFETH